MWKKKFFDKISYFSGILFIHIIEGYTRTYEPVIMTVEFIQAKNKQK